MPTKWSASIQGKWIRLLPWELVEKSQLIRRKRQLRKVLFRCKLYFYMNIYMVFSVLIFVGNYGLMVSNFTSKPDSAIPSTRWPFYKECTNSWLKSRENYVCADGDFVDDTKSQFCTGTACARLWHDVVIIYLFRARCLFTQFHTWAYDSFSSGSLGCRREPRVER